MKSYHVYILSNQIHGTLYIGVTNNIKRRLAEHKEGLGSTFVSKHKLFRLVYLEECSHINDARQRERTLKHWNRAWKIELLEKQNPFWHDLSEESPDVFSSSVAYESGKPHDGPSDQVRGKHVVTN